MKNLYLVFALFFVSLVQAQNPAAVDLSFDYQSSKPFLNGQINESYVQSDGKIILWGDFTECRLGKTGEIVKANHIIRLNSDLTIDRSFQFGEKLVGDINGLGLQSTDKLVVSVNSTATYNGVVLNKMFRLNPDGTFDTTFQNSDSYVYIFVLNNDKILYKPIGGIGIYRLNSDGSPDNVPYGPTGEVFGGGSVDSFFRRFPDGTVISTSNNTLYKVNGDGTTDMNFWNDSSSFNCAFNAFEMQPDGKILVGGFFNKYNKHIFSTDTNTTTPAKQLIRLNANNTLDTSFNSQGFDISTTTNPDCQTSGVRMIRLQADGKILVAGFFPSYGTTQTQKLLRLNADGSIDPTFNAITNFNHNICHLKVLPNGTILVGTYKLFNDTGIYPNYQNFEVANFFALDHNGNLLYTDKSSGVKIKKIVKNNSNFLLLGETRLPYHRGVKLIDNDGGLEPNSNLFDAFDANYNFGDDAVSVLAGAVQADGKILLGGAFTKYNGTSVAKLVRLNSDYTIDASFNLGSGFTRNPQPEITNIDQITIQPDGKIIVSGFFNIFNGQSFPGGTIRLNANGSLDTSFNYSGSNPWYKVILLSDGKILAADNSAIKRYNANGSLDASFTAISNFGTDFDLQSTGKIIAGSQRFNTDGSADSSFNEMLGIGSSNAIKVQADDKILAGGYYLTRYNADGTLDAAFEAGSFNNQINNIAIDNNGRILVAGDFTRYDGVWCTGIIRLVGGDAYVIRGQNKYDSDNNGCDENDIVFPNMKLKITNGLNTMDIIPNTTGDYAFTVTPGTYTVTPSIPAGAFSVTPASFTVTFPSAASPAVQDFCLSSVGIHPDLEVKMIPFGASRPGFIAKYKIIYKNKGNQLQSGTVNLNFNDAVIDYNTATPSITSQSANSLNWNFTNLFPLEQREIIVSLRLNSPTQTPPLNSGSILNYTTVITSAMTDDTPGDNTFAWHQMVVNSFDPNDKTCLEGATISTTQVGDYVHYMIRFENKGTYNAQNISVKDVIDSSKFDINTLTPLSGSHLYVTRITEGDKVEFYFEDINLPFDDANNDGYVLFKIKTKASLVSGDTFSNTAAIYFDYNSAIITNTATTAVQALANQDFAFDRFFTVYPNPVSALLNIDKKQDMEITSLSVFNTLGQLLITIPNAQRTSTIDVSGLKSGNYFLRINSDKGVSNTKFIKL